MLIVKSHHRQYCSIVEHVSVLDEPLNSNLTSIRLTLDRLEPIFQDSYQVSCETVVALLLSLKYPTWPETCASSAQATAVTP